MEVVGLLSQAKQVVIEQVILIEAQAVVHHRLLIRRPTVSQTRQREIAQQPHITAIVAAIRHRTNRHKVAVADHLRVSTGRHRIQVRTEQLIAHRHIANQIAIVEARHSAAIEVDPRVAVVMAHLAVEAEAEEDKFLLKQCLQDE